mgnify:CR=1 FL=1
MGGPPEVAFAAFADPPREFSLLPFWFWNDELTEAEILRQIADFEAHGIFGFVLHPRVGLPRSIAWMSERMLGFMAVAIGEAERRGMQVVLYDEGMYPSGSSCGQVVAENPAFACRGLVCRELSGDSDAPELPAGHNLVAVVRRAGGRRIAVIDRPVGSTIRGLHYRDDDPPRHPGPDDPRNPGSPRPDPPEDEPAAADILNPAAIDCFIRHVHQRLHDRFAPHFGRTVTGFFTDEPSLLGRGAKVRGAVPGTTDILGHVNRFLGYDFAPHLPALWFDDEPEAARFRADYERAVRMRLEETYYRRLSEWCAAHGVALAGHPHSEDEIGLLRQFHWPGQDLVWRHVAPGGSGALEGRVSTMAKCSSSAALHLGRRRNLNEFCGAYGHGLTFDEMKWLADWCLVRGVDLLIPHAFYYSVRGPRKDERPPDVGPNSPWWGRFREFADYCRRLSWMNAEGRQSCAVAVLGLSDFLPWRAARALFESQIDFNYLEARHLWQDAEVGADGVRLAGMHYRTVVLDGLPALPGEAARQLAALREAGRLVEFAEEAGGRGRFLAAVERLAGRDLTLEPAHDGIRFRHVVHGDAHLYLLHNESDRPFRGRVQLAAAAGRKVVRLDPWTGRAAAVDLAAPLDLGGHETVVLGVGVRPE